MCVLQLIIIVVGILFSLVGLFLIVKKFNDGTSNGRVKLMGIEATGPSKLIITVLGVGLIIVGAKMECKDKFSSAHEDNKTNSTSQTETIDTNKITDDKKLPSITTGLIRGMINKVVWTGNEKDTSLNLKYSAHVRPTLLIVGSDHPNGINIEVVFSNVAVGLQNVIKMDSMLTEFGDLDNTNILEVATHDFDKDGNPEIIVAIGDEASLMKVNVIKYYPPNNMDDAIRIENWAVVGNFGGQESIEISGDKITAPYGSQGLYSEYTWVSGKFVQTQ